MPHIRVRIPVHALHFSVTVFQHGFESATSHRETEDRIYVKFLHRAISGVKLVYPIIRRSFRKITGRSGFFGGAGVGGLEL